MTFSIVAHCPRTRMLGVAVATAVPAVGSICPYVKTGVGSVSTQSWVNPYLAIDALRMMEEGSSGPAALDAVMAADAAREVRQIGVVDAHGRSAAWSGNECTDWFGQIASRTSRCRETCWFPRQRSSKWQRRFVPAQNSILPSA